MKTYQCHKRVKAAQITSVEAIDVEGQAYPDFGVVVGSDGASFQRLLPASMCTRYQPQVGDYFVEYEDGYQSISPKAAFEAGYSLVSEVPTIPALTIINALEGAGVPPADMDRIAASMGASMDTAAGWHKRLTTIMAGSTVTQIAGVERYLTGLAAAGKAQAIEHGEG